jgi:hypothetical protein
VSRRERAPAPTPRPEIRSEVDLDMMQGPLFVGASIAGLLYLMRLGGAFPHPGDHLVGIACWAVLLGCASGRLVWEARQGAYPMRWGGFFVLVISFLLGVGLLVEISVATDPHHSENQPQNLLN